MGTLKISIVLLVTGLPGQYKLGGQAVPGFDVAQLDAARFRAIHAAVAPKAERWTEIPWISDLGAARQKAAKEQKPLLMWVMDGHPLGCT